MSLANEITGMTDAELREYEIPRVHTRSQINLNGPIPRNVRMSAGLVVFPDELEEERKALRKDAKKFLSQRRKEADSRIRERRRRGIGIFFGHFFK